MTIPIERPMRHRLLDRTSADPDDDLAMLSRQFLRTVEALRLAHPEITGLAAYLQTCDHEVILADLPATIASLKRLQSGIEARIR